MTEVAKSNTGKLLETAFGDVFLFGAHGYGFYGKEKLKSRKGKVKRGKGKVKRGKGKGES